MRRKGNMTPSKTWAIVSLAFALGVLATPVAADAQQAGKVYRVGELSLASGPGPFYEAFRLYEIFRQRLLVLGWLERQNFAIESRYAAGSVERLPDLATELVRLKVDVILTADTPTTLAAKRATATIPIVMIGIRDPVGQGFVSSLARPAGNITGLADTPPDELGGKLVELLKEAVPKASRVAVLWNSTTIGGDFYLKTTQVAARRLGIKLQILDVRGRADFEKPFDSMIKEHATALLVLFDPLFLVQRHRLIEVVAKYRLPAMYGQTVFVGDGGLMGYGQSLSEVPRRLAVYVDKILKGAKPADLPVEQPTKFELVINLKTAKALGLTIPQSVLIRADEVIPP